MINSLLTSENLKKFIDSLKINEEQKKSLISKLPQMDEKQRLEFLSMLEKVYLLDMEEKEAIEKIEKNWEEPEEQN